MLALRLGFLKNQTSSRSVFHDTYAIFHLFPYYFYLIQKKNFNSTCVCNFRVRKVYLTFYLNNSEDNWFYDNTYIFKWIIKNYDKNANVNLNVREKRKPMRNWENRSTFMIVCYFSSFSLPLSKLLLRRKLRILRRRCLEMLSNNLCLHNISTRCHTHFYYTPYSYSYTHKKELYVSSGA